MNRRKQKLNEKSLSRISSEKLAAQNIRIGSTLQSKRSSRSIFLSFDRWFKGAYRFPSRRPLSWSKKSEKDWLVAETRCRLLVAVDIRRRRWRIRVATQGEKPGGSMHRYPSTMGIRHDRGSALDATTRFRSHVYHANY